MHPAIENRLPHTFRGPLAFNQRSVREALGSLLQRGPRGEPLHGSEMTTAELANILMLLESVAMSNGMFVDGTLPQEDLEKLDQDHQELLRETGVPLSIGRLNTNGEELGCFFQEAAETASLSMQEVLGGKFDDGDRPMAGDHSTFVSDLIAASQDRSGRARIEIAAKIADKASIGVDTYRGSKCAAGIVLAQSEAVDLLPLAAERLGTADDGMRQRLVGALVNRFRINYINALAGLEKAAYLADGSIADQKGAQVLLFWRYLTRKLAALHKVELPEDSASVLDVSLSSVPLGVAILMNTQGSRPADLIAHAMDVRDLRFARAAAQSGPQERFIHRMTPEEFESFQEYLFRDQVSRLIMRDQREALSQSPWRMIRIPAALGAAAGGALQCLLTAAGAATGGLAGLAVTLLAGGVAAPVLGSVWGNVMEDLSTGRFGQARVHLDSYRKLDAYLGAASKQQRLVESFAAKVERLFGRKLATAGQAST